MLKGFSELLFGNKSPQDRDIGIFLAILLGFILVINLVTEDVDFVQPHQVTRDSYYGTPRSDPNRKIHHFDYQNQRYIYEDEVDRSSARPQPRHQQSHIRGTTRREREAIRELREVHQDQVRRDYEDILDEHGIDW